MLRVPLAPAPITCPYCCATFPARRVHFRCAGRPGPAGQTCPLAQDPVLYRQMGDAKDQGPAFQPTGLRPGRSRQAACPRCGGLTYYRICPLCHSLLPVRWGLDDSLLFAVAGAPDAGKTAFLTVLVHELKHRVGDRLGPGFMDADDATARFIASCEARLYSDGRMLNPSESAHPTRGRVPPRVFHMFDGGTGRGKVRRTLFSLFDTAGEDFSSRPRIEAIAPHLACANGIILVLDPLRLAGARKLAAPGTPLPADEAEHPAGILDRMHQLLLDRQPGQPAMIDIPVAVIVTKIDALWQTFSDSSPLRRPAQLGPAFDTADSLEVHEEILDLLRGWAGDRIDSTLRRNYRRYRYFGVSALGRPPTADQRVAPTGIQPYRVEDPLLWLLSEYGAIARTGRAP